jgi:hypothetical protein
MVRPGVAQVVFTAEAEPHSRVTDTPARNREGGVPGLDAADG